MRKKILCFVLSLIAVLSTSVGCAGDKGAENMRVDTDRLYGMCYIAMEFESRSGLRKDVPENSTYFEKVFEIMNNMGVRSFRNWMHIDWLLDDPNTVNRERCDLMHEIIAQAKKYDIQVIGMSHNWFTGSGEHMCVPYRNMTEGSYYIKFLLNYQQSWATLVREFPEVELWEIGNELNNDDFVHPFKWATEGYTFTMKQKANIAADMLYYASKGIHSSNKDATTIMGGLSSGKGFYTGRDAAFLEILYQNILSGEWPSTNPDDYFQCLAWHPYSFDKKVSDEWVECNNEIYAVARKYEGHDKKVYLTEFGFPDTLDNTDEGYEALLDRNCEWLEAMFKTVKEKMPYVEAVHCQRFFNDYEDYQWIRERSITSYGFFHDPLYEDAGPKSLAYTFQKLAGGTGNLDLIRNDNPLENIYFK